MSCVWRTAACDPACPGWVWSYSDGYGLERCDECTRFSDDDAAAAHVHDCLPCCAWFARLDLRLDCGALDRANRAYLRAKVARTSGPLLISTVRRAQSRRAALVRRARAALRESQEYVSTTT